MGYKGAEWQRSCMNTISMKVTEYVFIMQCHLAGYNFGYFPNAKLRISVSDFMRGLLPCKVSPNYPLNPGQKHLPMDSSYKRKERNN